MSWIIRGYERNGEKLSTEIQVDDLIREWFRSSLGIVPADPMFDSFPLPTDVLATFLGSLGATISDEREDFFLDYDAEPPLNDEPGQQPLSK